MVDSTGIDAQMAAAQADHEAKVKATGMLAQQITPEAGQTLTPAVFVAGQTLKSPPPASGGGGGSVICTKFYKLGLCEKEVFYAENKWGAWLLKNDPMVMHGYYLWGIPVAKQLNRVTWYGRLLIKIMYPFFNACSLETAAQQGVYRPRSRFTKALGKVTIALVLVRMNRLIGKTRSLLEGSSNVARA